MPTPPFLRWSVCLVLSAATALAQADAPELALTDIPVATALADKPAQSWAWGVGWLHYTEPGVMRLHGPEATVQWQHRPTTTGWPEHLQVDVGAAALNYSSPSTGSLHAVPALSGRGTALWRLYGGENAVWRAGLQLDLLWTDLRGTSSTGHRGYRRLGSKAWAVLRHEAEDGARTEIGALLQGRQDSLLTDAGSSRDIRNTQRHGVYVAYQHSPIGALRWRPWLRYSRMERSEPDGAYYEPRDQMLQLGALLNW